MKLNAMLFGVVPAVITAHSWVACTNYNTKDTNYLTFGDFDRRKCLGYPRSYQVQHEAEMVQSWGIDSGYSWEHSRCRYTFDNNEYGDITPMAIYYAGQLIHISHPAKNHVADVCTNQFIPSQSIKLFMSSSPMVDTFDISVAMVGEDHRNGQMDHLGFQNCYNFCGDADKAHCLTSWTLPLIDNPGRYSFNWVWEFNADQFYSTCFDALILPAVDNSTISRTSSPNPTPASSTPSTTDSTRSTPSTTPSTTNSTLASSAPSTTNSTLTSSAPSTTRTGRSKYPITSDGTQLKSIINKLFNYIRLVFNGTLNFSMVLNP